MSDNPMPTRTTVVIAVVCTMACLGGFALMLVIAKLLEM